MRIRKNILASAVALGVPAIALYANSNSNAYVLVSGNGSITPLYPHSSYLGASYFVPAGGIFIAIAPGSKQIWEVVSVDGSPASIAVLDPQSGATLANIPLGVYVASLTFDPGGRYAYVSAVGYLIKIEVASRTVVRKVACSALGHTGQVAFSSDGSQLFLPYPSFPTDVLVAVDPVSLKTLSSIHLPFRARSILVSGNTLLVTGGTELLYLDTNTLQQTNSAAVAQNSALFGVSGDGSKIYLYADEDPGTNMAILDFLSGAILVSQPFSNGSLPRVILSPDGRQIVAASNPVLVVDPNTLSITRTIVPMGGVVDAAYVDPKTVLLLNNGSEAMVTINQETAQITASIPIDHADSAVADPKLGAVWVGGSVDSALSAVSAASNQVTKSFLMYGFSPAARVGNQIFGTDNSGAAYYNLATGAHGYLPPIINLGQNYYVDVGPGAVPPGGKSYWAPFGVYQGGGGDAQIPPGGIGIYSTASNTVVARIALPDFVSGPLVFGPEGTTAYIPSPNVIAVYDTRTLRNTQTFHYTTTFTALAISADGSRLYATDSIAVYVLDSATGAQRQFFPLPSPPSYYPGVMALSPDGITLFLTNWSANVVYLIDTTSGQIRQVPVGLGPSSIAVLPSN